MADALRSDVPPGGRGNPYPDAVWERILERLAEGESLRRICNDEGMPTSGAVCLRSLRDEEFGKRYARARQVGYLLLAEDLIPISDDGRNDTTVNENGDVVTNHDVIARSRLRVDTRKWILAKMLPKVYGEKLAVEQSGPDGAPIQHEFHDARRKVRSRIAGIAARSGTNGDHRVANGNGGSGA